MSPLKLSRWPGNTWSEHMFGLGCVGRLLTARLLTESAFLSVPTDTLADTG